MRRSPVWRVSTAVFLLTVATLLSGTAVASADGSVQVNVDHTIIQPGDETLMFMIVTQVTNPGDEQVDEVRLSLPTGCENFRALQGLTEGAYELVDGDLVSSTPLAAGETREVLYAFTMPWDGEAIEWTKHVNYPTQMLFVLVPEGALDVVSEDLEVGTTQAIDDTPYVQYYAAGVAQDTELAVRIESPEAGAETVQPGHWELEGFLILAFGILLIAGVVVGVRRGWFSRRGRGVAPGLTQLDKLPDDRLQNLREDLMSRLVEMELAKRRGEVPDDQYEDDHKEVLRQLVRVELALRKRS